MLKIDEVSKIVGVTIKTLKIWDNTSKLKSVMLTTGGHRRYSLHSIEKFVGKPLAATNARGGRKIKQIIKELEKERQGENIEINSKSDVG